MSYFVRVDTRESVMIRCWHYILRTRSHRF